MVIDPDQFRNHRIVATDPGTSTLGVAVLSITDSGLMVEHATTLVLGKLARNYPLIVEKHSERIAKLYATTDAVLKLLLAWQPTYVASEGPYMGSFPTAYAALVESVDAIRRAVIRYDPYLDFSVTDPASVKKAIGVSGKSGDKELVRAAVSKHATLTLHPEVNLSELDEHAIDAIAVGLHFYLTHLKR